MRPGRPGPPGAGRRRCPGPLLRAAAGSRRRLARWLRSSRSELTLAGSRRRSADRFRAAGGQACGRTRPRRPTGWPSRAPESMAAWSLAPVHRRPRRAAPGATRCCRRGRRRAGWYGPGLRSRHPRGCRGGPVRSSVVVATACFLLCRVRNVTGDGSRTIGRSRRGRCASTHVNTAAAERSRSRTGQAICGMVQGPNPAMTLESPR